MTTDTTSQIAVALAQGRLSDAERLCRDRLDVYSRDENALLMLAITLQCQQRQQEALDIYEALTCLTPESGVHWFNLGVVQHGMGHVVEAEAAYVKAIDLDAKGAMPRLQYGRLLLEQKRYLAARDVLLDAFDRAPQMPAARILAAKACCSCQDFSGADDLLGPWRTWFPLNDDALQLELAKLHNQMSDTPSAAMVLEDMLTRVPGHVEARLLLANIYERLNRLSDAEKMIVGLAGEESEPREELQRELSHLRAALAIRHNNLTMARQLLEHSGPRHATDYAHFFNLAQVCDKQGDTKACMQALHEAHRLQKEEVEIASPEHYTKDAAPLPAATLKVSPADYARWPELIAPDVKDSPVFIVGFPRSGTTLLEQMLDAHPGLQSMDENPFFNRLADKLRRVDPRILDDLGVLGQRDCDELRKQYLLMVSGKISRRWDAQLVDKNPLNMLWLPMICRLFPKAKFILAVRHPCDVILSCYMQNFRASILAAACENIGRLAEAYAQAMNTWLTDVETFAPNVLVSRYEDLVADFPAHVALIADFLQLSDAAPMHGFDEHARNKGYIGTPSYSQVIEPVNHKGLGRWLKYRNEFTAALPILEPLLQRWNYSIDPPRNTRG